MAPIFDLPPKLWTPQPAPAIVRAASLKDIDPYLGMPLGATFAAASKRGYSAKAFKPGAVTFDGTNDYMLRGGDLTGVANSKVGLFSCWWKCGGGSGTVRRFYANSTGPAISIFQETDNKIWVTAYIAGPTNIITMTSTTAYTTAVWRHILIAYDLAAGMRQMYIDGASDLAGGSSSTNTNVLYSQAEHGLGCHQTNIQRMFGDLSEFYFNQAATLDISVAGNREKFRSSAGLAVDLGSTGSAPTNSQPIIFQRHLTGAAVTDFGTNKGSGGNFTITGTLVEATGPNGA